MCARYRRLLVTIQRVRPIVWRGSPCYGHQPTQGLLPNVPHDRGTAVHGIAPVRHTLPAPRVKHQSLYATPALGSTSHHYQFATQYGLVLSVPVTVPANGSVSEHFAVGGVDACGVARNAVFSGGVYTITSP